MRIFFLVTLLLLTPPSQAFDLFGTRINDIDRVALREVIRNTGAEVLREAGDDNWYDIYNMSASFTESKKLYVGYDKNSGRFAFAEYHLQYEYFNTMLLRLEAKYGDSTRQPGRFDSDLKHRWLVDGIVIELQRDWYKDTTRLIYSQPANLAALQQAYQQSQLDAFNQSLKVDESYF